MLGLNLSSNSSVSGNSDKLDELRNIKDDVKDSEVTVLSAQVDQSISEHKIAAEIEEAFASIDLMENGSDDSEVNSSLEPYESKDVDEVIKWDEMPQTSKANNNVELPLLKSAKDTTDSPRQKFTDELQSQNSSRAGSIKLEEPTRIERKIENAPTERAPDDVQKDISRRVVYQKPVVNFSISSYKSRVEDDDCYHHKTVKTEDVQKPIETKPVSQYRTSQIVVPSNIMNRNVSKQDVVPGQAASITKAIGTKSKNEPSSNTSSNELHDVFNRLRKTKSEIVIGNQTEVKSQNPQSEQERLQQEYTKLHHQFLQWQQQLLQNQTVLQQQNILPESSSEALQRLQELNQQFFSLPLHKQTAQKKVDGMPLDQQDYAKKTQSLPRPKSTVMPVEERGPKPSELSKAPSFGSRCWRPVSMNSWNQRSKINKEPKIEIAEAKPPQDRSNKSSLPKGSQQPRDAISQDASPSVSKVVSRMANKDNTQSKDITISQKDAPVVVPKEEGRSVSVKESVSVFNVANSSDKPVKFSRPVSQVNMFPKCPVVKGFSFEPQKTSKILITTSKKTNLNDGGSGDVQNAPTSGPQGSKPGTVRVNIGANTNVKLSSSTVNTNGVNPKSGFNTNEYMYPASKQVHVIERSNKPVVQTKTYFGDKIESRANSCNNNSETTAAQKIARTISLKTPTNYNFSSPMYSTDDNDNVKRRQNSVVSSPPPPPPPPPQENGPDTVFNYNNGTRVNKDINRPATSRTASSSSNEDFKNELMLAIRDFGGRSGLKKVLKE